MTDNSRRDEINAKYGTPTTARNPFATGILWIWVLGGIVGVIFLIVGFNSDEFASIYQVMIGSSFLSLAVIGAMIHLAVKAIRWQP